MIEPVARGDPESPPRWTCDSKDKLEAEFNTMGHKVSATKVGRLLHDLGYGIQVVRKTPEGDQSPDRNAQFEHINRTAKRFIAKGLPVISIDTKKKELVGDFKNGGSEWQPKGAPEPYDVEEVQALLALDLNHGILAALAFYTGMRPGEIAGRRWRDLDQSAKPLGALSVRSQYDDQSLKGDDDDIARPRLVPVHSALRALEWENRSIGRWI